MRKSTIWILTTLMTIAFAGLLFMQLFYVKSMVRMRNEQFSDAVQQSLFGVSERLMKAEAQYYLDQAKSKASSTFANPLTFSFTTSMGIEGDLTLTGDQPVSAIFEQEATILSTMPKASRDMRDRYHQQRSIIDEAVISVISQGMLRPAKERADSGMIEEFLKEELSTRGLDMPFEFSLMNNVNTPIYRTGGFTPAEDQKVFRQRLFPRDPADKQLFLYVYFPEKTDYITSSLTFMYPTVAFTLMILVVFVVTIILAFRQKKLSEMKNDFINNMTHEFKTPISSISLAAQMLNDQSVRKSPTMLQQISNVINDETKRLRFQVEKVLQMSMFERQKASLKLEEVDANVVLYNVVNTFKLKVEKYGGTITAQLDAMNAIVMVDEMHFTNVIFNLLDNAVKYRRDEVPLNLVVSSRDLPDEQLEITVSDNGIGIRKDDLKKIFEKFYRVSTGNRHDVKGFGLGLAYVHKMIKELGGHITVESELNVGTKFIIILPLSKN